MDRKRILIWALLLAYLLGGCAQTATQPPAADPAVLPEPQDVIRDVYTDKARYAPGETPVLTVELMAQRDIQAELEVRVTHLTEAVYTAAEPVRLKAGQAQQKELDLVLPETDFTGYAVEVYVKQGEHDVDRDMTAAEVASDWSKFPRYGYLTDYSDQTEEQLRQTLERLNKHHITGLFYYDVLDRHDRPLAGSVDAPDSHWKTLAGHDAYRSTVQSLIDMGHGYNMNSYLYNLIFGSYEDLGEGYIDPKWGLYCDRNGLEQDYHGELPDAWEAQRLYLFDPSNMRWQDYYLEVTQDVLAVYGYDGIQGDSLGYRGDRYDHEGDRVNLAQAYVPLLDRLAEELDTRVIFNPVGGYGMSEMLAGVDYDIVYEEVWPWDGASYFHLKDWVDGLRREMSEDKGIVLAAYMNYKSQKDAFNMPGILLTDAVLMASGAAHLELGDTGMLKTEYYPGDTLKIGQELEQALRNYYSFSVAYENYLREPAFREIITRPYIDGEQVSLEGSAGKIWCMTKEHDGIQVMNFINLVGIRSTQWVDNDGDQPVPQRQQDLEVRHYVKEIPICVYLASPDLDEGIMTELDFEVGEDDRGTYICFTMPELAYWNMVVIQ